ncbi:hypothetical protein GCM10023083_44170 [Streptomyces phyllanthi]
MRSTAAAALFTARPKAVPERSTSSACEEVRPQTVRTGRGDCECPLRATSDQQPGGRGQDGGAAAVGAGSPVRNMRHRFHGRPYETS